MAAVRLSNGLHVLVDEVDLTLLSKYRWHFNGEYAYRCVGKDGRRSVVLMHRDILKPTDGIQVDHANGNRLDKADAAASDARRRLMTHSPECEVV